MQHESYVGGTQKLTAEQAAKEFELQTKLKPLQSRWARVQPGSTTTALVLAFSPEVVASLPTRVTLFRWNRPVIKKAPKVRIQQYSRCWGFHPERYCNRKLRYRRCSSKDHQEGHPVCHKEKNRYAAAQTAALIA
ncbi:hypothetical protein VTO42DRAFT_2566 [Malbranchea cinnamomea]